MDTTAKTGPITSGVNVCFGRVIAARSYNACLYAGIKISGSNAEFMPRQWKFQIGSASASLLVDVSLLAA
jgi:glutamine synthetase